jgi:hypothetical protein
MPFRARKLRVQLPCSAEGSVIDLADGESEKAPAEERAYFPFTCYLTMLDYCHCSVLPPRTYPPAGCIDSSLKSLPVVLEAESERLVDPDLLPLLKKQLENRLAEIDLAADVAKKRTQADLDDIALAEQTLRDQRAEEQPGD